MRFILRLLSLLALTLAPFTAPAQAMTVDAKQTHCADMGSQSDQHPIKPQPDDARCCVAVPAALPASAAASSATPPREKRISFSTVLQLAGLQSEAEDPPPRS
ncbi:hypothetical protein [uncultured Sphingomonas sp.]|nr:hypothetical protein [uncultured Sphingomonas sp.]